MQVKRQDLCTLALYFLGYCRITRWLLRTRGETLTTIVTFHDLPGEALDDFRRKLSWLKQTSNVVSLRDYFSGRLSRSRVNSVITFDDGYRSWATSAVPMLQEFSLPATFFVCSGFVGLSEAAAEEFARSRLQANGPTTGCLTAAELKGIAAAGFQIGGHTVNHINLATVSDEAAARQEITADKAALESVLGCKVDYFAYPFGEFDNPRMDGPGLVAAAGYRGAVSLLPGFNTSREQPYRLRRELTGTPMAGCVFKSRVLGAYQGVDFVRTRGKRLVSFAGRAQKQEHLL